MAESTRDDFAHTPDFRDKMQTEIAVGRIAQDAGVGVDMHGQVEMPEFDPAGNPSNAIGIGMGRAPGGFAEQGFAQTDAQSRELAAHALNVNGTTIDDVRRFRDALTTAGWIARGDTQGFVGPDGKWSPIDLTSYGQPGVNGLSAMTPAEIAFHNQEQFDRYIASLQSSHDAAAAGTFDGVDLLAPTP